MTEVFHNAPITEAVIDIRVRLPENVALAEIENLYGQIKAEYPSKAPRNLWEGKFEIKGKGEPHTESRLQQLGYKFTNADNSQVVQFRLDGFTFSRLRPYTQWEDVCPKARRLWGLFMQGTKPVEVTRLAVRYINSIEIPSKDFDLDDYFTAIPKIPDGLPQVLDSFFVRTQIPFAEQDATAVTVQTPANKQDPTKTAILVDIDVFRTVSLLPEDERIWEIFNKLREIKNAIFRRSITPKTEALFR